MSKPTRIPSSFLGPLRPAARLTKHLLQREPPAPGALLPAADLDVGMGAVARVLRYVQPELRHVERVPAGGALLTGNHSLMGVDSFALYPLLWQQLGRLPRGLADRALFTLPSAARAFGRIGAVPGDPQAAVELLQQGELCLVYPGGSAESFKDPDQRYQLFWNERFGFAKVAMRAQVPVVPVMAAGPDHAYRFLFRERWLARRLVGQGKARYDFPLSLGLGMLPLPVKFTYEIGEPIAPPTGAHLADDPAAVAAFHQKVWRTCQAQLDRLVAEWHSQTSGTADRLARRFAG
ncbi:MAG: acyltransferase family protein [Deltaproteobacteria bacterium]|nr:acyltransferase family protein [Deltaproteobacteria bacterium]